MNQGPHHSVLWITVSRLSYQFDAKEVHQWLQKNLAFWADDKPFDHMGFVAWYERANFMDKEIVYKYLTPPEQKAVLKAWAEKMSSKPITPSYNRPTPANQTDFLDGPLPIREKKKPIKKAAYTKLYAILTLAIHLSTMLDCRLAL